VGSLADGQFRRVSERTHALAEASASIGGSLGGTWQSQGVQSPTLSHQFRLQGADRRSPVLTTCPIPTNEPMQLHLQERNRKIYLRFNNTVKYGKDHKQLSAIELRFFTTYRKFSMTEILCEGGIR